MTRAINIDELLYLRNKRRFTWQLVADFLGLPLRTLEGWLQRNRHKLDIQVQKVQAEPGEYQNKKANRIAQQFSYKSIRSLVRDWRMSGKTVAEIANATGLHVNTITRNTPPELKGEIVIKTEKQRDAARRNLEKGRQVAHQRLKEGKHIWQTK